MSMSPTIKESLKFSLLLVFCLGIIVLACFLVQPYSRQLDTQRQADIASLLVPGEARVQPVVISDDGAPVQVYRYKKDRAVVFLRVHLFMKDRNLAMLVEGDKVVSMLDVDLGLTPVNPNLRSLFSNGSGGKGLGDLLAQAGPDVMGGATVDFSRLSAVLARALALVKKAGEK
jgi:hypothetical protein